MLLRILLLLLLPACAIAQDCDCCKIRTLGQQKYDAGDYTGAKSTWETAQKMGDAAKCTDLDALIAKAQKKMDSPKPAPKKKTAPKTKPAETPQKKPLPPVPLASTKKSGLTMIPVAGGTFTMGSPDNELNRNNNECQHSVTVGNFSIGQYEVTQADWKAVMGNNPSSFYGCDECPVETVSWQKVQEFITAANKKYGRKYRLPTEAEWEYAARGGNKSKTMTYAGSNTSDDVAWHNGNAGKKTHEVGTKIANELGLYDMSGNVFEWCSDPWGAYPGCSSPKDERGSLFVLRGGSWYFDTNYSRVASRYRVNSVNRSSYYGFRLAQD
jgi:sulfatase modifying factor 1